ncbi:zinc transporter ZIP2 isoform X2 [Phacochoerus africanus]|uniref:zinc transporter ZIP2 isoform X2 n=1 Tax=Phacochoerus africanus TaxID=41426 RepID=UPI001FD90F6B|nr:zinc transporter ZIP2 isoform X2 [Phacochoerus africanus]
MEPLLGVKIGCLFALLVLTLICGLIPICFKWFQTDRATGRHRRILSLLGCTSAGVFLGAGFMHMTAEALEGIESEIQKLVIQNRTKSKGNSSDDADSSNLPRAEGLRSSVFEEEERRQVNAWGDYLALSPLGGFPSAFLTCGGGSSPSPRDHPFSFCSFSFIRSLSNSYKVLLLLKTAKDK